LPFSYFSLLLLFFLFLLRLRLPLSSPLFPYTTALPIFCLCPRAWNSVIPSATGRLLLLTRLKLLAGFRQTSLGDRHQFIGLSRRSEEHTSELQSRFDLVCRLLLEKKN